MLIDPSLNIAHPMAQGFSQELGIDYHESFYSSG
jgi:hypothetical protein